MLKQTTRLTPVVRGGSITFQRRGLATATIEYKRTSQSPFVGRALGLPASVLSTPEKLSYLEAPSFLPDRCSPKFMQLDTHTWEWEEHNLQGPVPHSDSFSQFLIPGTKEVVIVSSNGTMSIVDLPSKTVISTCQSKSPFNFYTAVATASPQRLWFFEKPKVKYFVSKEGLRKQKHENAIKKEKGLPELEEPHETPKGIAFWDKSTDAITQIQPKGNGPSNTATLQVLPWENNILVFSAEEESLQVFLLDTNKNEWSKLAVTGEAPSARDGYALSFLPGKNKAILISGLALDNKGSPVSGLKEVWSFDPSAKKWEKVNLEGSVLQRIRRSSFFGGRHPFIPAFGAAAAPIAEDTLVMMGGIMLSVEPPNPLPVFSVKVSGL
ncbi:hypothetical protein QOT17_006064 [Balamuthia mandrillaris]